MYTAAVLTVSDRSFRGERPDAGGPLVAELLRKAEPQAALFHVQDGSIKAA